MTAPPKPVTLDPAEAPEAPSVQHSPRSGLPVFVRRIHYAELFVAPFILVAAISVGLYALAHTMENVF